MTTTIRDLRVPGRGLALLLLRDEAHELARQCGQAEDFTMQRRLEAMEAQLQKLYDAECGRP